MTWGAHAHAQAMQLQEQNFVGLQEHGEHALDQLWGFVQNVENSSAAQFIPPSYQGAMPSQMQDARAEEANSQSGMSQTSSHFSTFKELPIERTALSFSKPPADSRTSSCSSAAAWSEGVESQKSVRPDVPTPCTAASRKDREAETLLSQTRVQPADTDTKAGGAVWCVSMKRFDSSEHRITTTMQVSIGDGLDMTELVVTIRPRSAGDAKGKSSFKGATGVGCIELKSRLPLNMDLQVSVSVGALSPWSQKHNFAKSSYLKVHGDWDFRAAQCPGETTIPITLQLEPMESVICTQQLASETKTQKVQKDPEAEEFAEDVGMPAALSEEPGAQQADEEPREILVGDLVYAFFYTDWFPATVWEIHPEESEATVKWDGEHSVSKLPFVNISHRHDKDEPEESQKAPSQRKPGQCTMTLCS